MRKFFTSESVTEGHPDKVCDNISDGILDAVLTQDCNARAAIECAAAFDTLLIMGEVTTTATVDYEKTAREIIKSATISVRSRTINARLLRLSIASPPILRWA